MDEAEQLAVNRTAQAQAEVDKIQRDLTPRGAADTAAELRATRAWDRTVRALEGCTESSAVAATVGRLIADADPETLGTLLEELPSYCASRGVPGDVVDQAVSQAVPELAAAQQQLAKSRAAEAIVRADANRRRDGLSQGRLPYIPPVDPVKHDPDR